VKKPTLVSSRSDPASSNICEHVKEALGSKPKAKEISGAEVLEYPELRIVEVEGELIEYVPREELLEEASFFIYLSRHESASGAKSLTVHTPGLILNHKASFSIANPPLASSLLCKIAQLRESIELEYHVSFEATHHGPVLEAPITFVEIGSSKDAWTDPRAGKLLASAVLGVLREGSWLKGENCVGVGGGHYAAKFTKNLIEERKLLYGHILSKHQIEEHVVDIVLEAVEKTSGGCRTIAIDKKGLKGERKREVKELAEKLGLKVVKV